MPFIRFPSIRVFPDYFDDTTWWHDAEDAGRAAIASREASFSHKLRQRVHLSIKKTLPGWLLPKLKLEQQIIYAASWENMLCIFPDHLDLFEYQSPNRGTDSLFFYNTEYIPDDVRAAPATGMVETIITLAALAGSDSIRAARNEVSGLPTAHGSNVQLSFREHAQLGSVAILQKCPGPNTYHEYVAIRESEAWIFFKFNSKRRYRKMMIPKVILQYYLPVDPMLLKDNYVFSVYNAS